MHPRRRGTRAEGVGRGGALIHVSSVEAQVAMPYQSAYAASKLTSLANIAFCIYQVVAHGTTVLYVPAALSAAVIIFLKLSRPQFGLPARRCCCWPWRQN